MSSLFPTSFLFNSITLLIKRYVKCTRIFSYFLNIKELCGSPAHFQTFLHFNSESRFCNLKDPQAPEIWGHPKVHQAPLGATSAEIQPERPACLQQSSYDFSAERNKLFPPHPPHQRVQEIRVFLNSLLC